MEIHKRLHMVQTLTPDCTYRVDWGIGNVPRFIEQYDVDMDPPYQRGLRWSTEQKRKFVGFALQNHNGVPIFWFRRYKNWGDGKCEVVDGKQRLNAILEWTDGKFSALCPCEQEFTFSELNNDIICRRGISHSITLKMHFVQLNDADTVKFYIGLNSGGTAHKKSEIDNAKAYLASLEVNP